MHPLTDGTGLVQPAISGAADVQSRRPSVKYIRCIGAQIICTKIVMPYGKNLR